MVRIAAEEKRLKSMYQTYKKKKLINLSKLMTEETLLIISKMNTKHFIKTC